MTQKDEVVANGVGALSLKDEQTAVKKAGKPKAAGKTDSNAALLVRFHLHLVVCTD